MWQTNDMRPIAPQPAGQPLWGEQRRSQPIVPLVLLSMLTFLIAAPAAMSSQGRSSNPITLLHDIATSTYTLAGLMDKSNDTLGRIEGNVQPLSQISTNMISISGSAQGMADKTKALNAQLRQVGQAVGQSNRRLGTVDSTLGRTSSGLQAKKALIHGSLVSTTAVVREFGLIDTAIGGMDTGLKKTITLMSASTPLTRDFAANTTRVAIAGGDGHKYGVPNIVPNNKVMSVVLPMINTMQNGGALPARKNSADASNFLVGTLLKRQVPDGTNVNALVLPYDGFYGLPKPAFFVTTPQSGF
jgi:hypothetical protein